MRGPRGQFTCVSQCFRVRPGFNGQNVEQLPERTRVTPQLWAASLTANPLDVTGKEYSRNLGRKRKE